MADSRTIIKSLMRTEKSTSAEPQGKYLFLVDNSANKIQIKKAVEEIYKVKVKQVNTFVSIGKFKKVRYQSGLTPDKKKALVTLQQGQVIDTK